MKKPGLPLDAHKALGAELKALNRRLIEIECHILNAYPLPVIRGVKRAQAGILALRNALDQEVDKEHPTAEGTTGIYW
jgi:hypothetical protein